MMAGTNVTAIPTSIFLVSMPASSAVMFIIFMLGNLFNRGCFMYTAFEHVVPINKRVDIIFLRISIKQCL